MPNTLPVRKKKLLFIKVGTGVGLNQIAVISYAKTMAHPVSEAQINLSLKNEYP